MAAPKIIVVGGGLAGLAIAHWTLAGTALWASVLGFMVWVMAAATWMLEEGLELIVAPAGPVTEDARA